MSLTKFAAANILTVGDSPNFLRKSAHRADFSHVERKQGFLYVRSRAISSRVNDNYDGFPAEEIRKGYRTFIGRPVFVNHNNANHRRARGVIVDAALHEDVNPDGTPDTWAEVLMEVDAVRFPKLAEAIRKGHIDRTSMGVDVEKSQCSICGNWAANPLEYCSHIPALKGKRITRTTASGTKESVLCYEMCYGLNFFENSLLVEEPADPTAHFLGVDEGGEMVKAASKTKTAIFGQGVHHPDKSEYVGRCMVCRTKYCWPNTPLTKGVRNVPGDIQFDCPRPTCSGIVIQTSRMTSAEQGESLFHHLHEQQVAIMQRHRKAEGKAAFNTHADYARGGNPKNPGQFSSDQGPYKKKEKQKGQPKGQGAEQQAAPGQAPPGEAPAKRPGQKGTGTKDDPVQTEDVTEAVEALSQGLHVQLKQPRQASVLLDRLADVVAQARDAGEEAPPIDLCNVTVQNTNLFCTESQGYPRIQMPQLKGKPAPGSKAATLPLNKKGEADLQPMFRQMLIDEGIKIETGKEKASFLRPSQNELDGVKVAGMMDAMEAGRMSLEDDPVFISNDNYIVDGHHRWAALVGLDVADNRAGDIDMNIDRIDMDIITLLKRANDYAAEWGVPQRDMAGRTREEIAAAEAEGDQAKAAFLRRKLARIEKEAALKTAAADGCRWEITTRNPYMLPPNTYKHECGKPLSPTSRLYCPRHEKVDKDQLARAKFKQEQDTLRREKERRWQEKNRKSTKTGRVMQVSRQASSWHGLGDEEDVCARCGWELQNHSISGTNWDNAEIDCPNGMGEYKELTPAIIEERRQEREDEEADAEANRLYDLEHGAARKLAYGETKAPAKVDTLRDAACPVCGEETSWHDGECAVCGWVQPPDFLADPDLEKARQVDLRQDKQDQNEQAPGGGESLTCNNCGATFKGGEQADKPEGKATVEDQQMLEDNPSDPMDKLPPPENPPFSDKKRNEQPQDEEAEEDEDDEDEKDTPPWMKKKNPKPKNKAAALSDPSQDAVRDEDESESDNVSVGLEAGDNCPKCGEGVLEAGNAAGEQPVEEAGDTELEEEGDEPLEGEEPQDEGKEKPPFAKEQGDDEEEDEDEPVREKGEQVPPKKAPPKKKAVRKVGGERRLLRLPFSEVCMHMQVAGRDMYGELLDGGNAVQLFDLDGRPFSAPILAGEAGWGMTGSDHTLTDFDESGRWYPKSGAKNDSEGERVAMARPLMEAVQEQQRRIEAQRRVIMRQSQRIARLEQQVGFIARVAGLDTKKGFLRQADENNPAQPVPQPASEGPSQTTEEALKPDTTDDVQNVGEAPGSTEGVPADATADVTTPGEVMAAPESPQVDVLAPVAGTEEQRPLNETKIETDVRAGRPADTNVAFPLEGDFANKPTTGRLISALRLARLRIQAGIAEGDDLTLGSQIEQSDLSSEAIVHEVETLGKVLEKQAQTAPARQERRNLVPRTASQDQRSAPALSNQMADASVQSDEFLFD